MDTHSHADTVAVRITGTRPHRPGVPNASDRLPPAWSSDQRLCLDIRHTDRYQILLKLAAARRVANA